MWGGVGERERMVVHINTIHQHRAGMEDGGRAFHYEAERGAERKVTIENPDGTSSTTRASAVQSGRWEWSTMAGEFTTMASTVQSGR